MRCIVVEDVPFHREYFVEALRGFGHEVAEFTSGVDYSANPAPPADMILLDDKLGTLQTGGDLIPLLREHHPGAKIFSISGTPVGYADRWVGKNLDRETLRDLCNETQNRQALR